MLTNQIVCQSSPPVTTPAGTRFSRTTTRGKSPWSGAIKVHYFNNRTDSSKPTAPDDRKQHPLAAGQAVKKCRNPVFPIIGCVPAVFLAQCSYPLQWIYPSPTTHLLRFLPVIPTFTRFFEPCFLPKFTCVVQLANFDPPIRHVDFECSRLEIFKRIKVDVLRKLYAMYFHVGDFANSFDRIWILLITQLLIVKEQFVS